MRANPWIIVLVGFVALSVSFAFRAVLGLSIPEWERAVSSGGLGWSRDTISAASALARVYEQAQRFGVVESVASLQVHLQEGGVRG